MADNSAALARARRQASRTKRNRARQALQEMIDTGQRITFTAVARHAGVSVSLLYADSDLAAAVAEARDRQQQAGLQRTWGVPTRSLVTEQSLRTDLANANEQVRQLHDEVTVLRQRLARSLGADADAARGRAIAPLLDRLEDRAGELEAENHQLRRRISDLETELRDATESLRAARAANRDLMNMVNR
jgi:chromosome segregation ATPase